jgi:hypothetical protein
VDQKRYRTGSGAVAEDQEWQEAQVQEAEEKVDIETGRAGAINTHAPLTTITCLGDNDGCYSRYPVPFPTQPILHSPKLRIYEYLFLFNQKLQEAVQILKQLERCPWLRREFLRSFQIELEDLRAQTNFEVLEHMSDREQHDWAYFGKLRRDWDRQFEDPDDVYLKAEQREKERGKQGLPPRLGIIPHEAITAQETRLEAEQRRKKKRSRKAGS